MAIYCAGDIVKEMRKRKKISQEELCAGICEPPTLSKIENGRQIPSKRVFEALLQRLGMTIGIFNVPVSEEEFRRAQIEREIEMIISDEIAGRRIESLLEEFKGCGKMTELDRQVYLYFREIMNKDAGENGLAEKLRNLEKILKMTVPDYSDKFDISKKYLTTLELLLLNNIGASEFYLGNAQMAIAIMRSLKEYFETGKVDIAAKIKHYPDILSNLSNFLRLTGSWQECCEVAEAGIDFCGKNARLNHLMDFFFCKAFSLCNMGRKEEGRNFLVAAIVFGKLEENRDFLEGAKELSEKYYDENLPDFA